MTVDDVLAHMASTPKRDRPTELRSDTAMLQVWLFLRTDVAFVQDVIERHRLDQCRLFNGKPSEEHALSNAWGQAVEAWLKLKNRGD